MGGGFLVVIMRGRTMCSFLDCLVVRVPLGEFVDGLCSVEERGKP